MRFAVTLIALSSIAQACLIPAAAATQAMPAGWSDLVGKSCRLRVEDGSNGTGGEVVFGQGSSGPNVEIRWRITEVHKVTFTPRGGIRFQPIYSGGHYVFYYNNASKRWTGNLSGLPAYLFCSA